MFNMPIETLAAPDATAAACKNCGAELSGHYCSACGQANKDIDPSLHDLAHEFIHEFAHLDGKIVATLKALVFRPGSLSAEFLAGRRARYIGPLRMYLTCSLLCFLVVAWNPGAKHGAKVELKGQSKIELNAEIGSEGKNSRLAKSLSEAASKASQNPELLGHAFRSNMSRVMFIIVPLFALALRLAYRNRRRRYPAFVYFSLHFHAFAFLALTIYVLIGFTHLSTLDSLAGYALVIVLPGYLFMAMRRVFGGSRAKTALRIACLAAFYLPCFVIGLAVAGAISLLAM
jgi:hypothetical protein